MGPAGESQLDALVHHALAVETVGDAHLAQQVHRALLEHPRAHARLHVAALTGLEHHRLDAEAVEQVAEDQAGRACAHDGHLGADTCPRAGSYG